MTAYRPIEPGIYRTEDGLVAVNVNELLRHHGLPIDANNVQRALRALREISEARGLAYTEHTLSGPPPEEN